MMHNWPKQIASSSLRLAHPATQSGLLLMLLVIDTLQKRRESGFFCQVFIALELNHNKFIFDKAKA